jgi:DNA-binding protein H-NS
LWSGRGRQPGWIKQALAEGNPKSDFAEEHHENKVVKLRAA